MNHHKKHTMNYIPIILDTGKKLYDVGESQRRFSPLFPSHFYDLGNAHEGTNVRTSEPHCTFPKQDEQNRTGAISPKQQCTHSSIA